MLGAHNATSSTPLEQALSDAIAASPIQAVDDPLVTVVAIVAGDVLP